MKNVDKKFVYAPVAMVTDPLGFSLKNAYFEDKKLPILSSYHANILSFMNILTIIY